MKKAVIFLYIGLISYRGYGQDKLFQIQSGLQQYFETNPVFYGLFDSIENYFAIHFDNNLISDTSDFSLQTSGKTWHRGEITTFYSNIFINSIEPQNDSLFYQTGEDSADIEPLSVPGVKFASDFKKHLSVWVCEGEIHIIEDSTQLHSGIFSGLFTFYFLYDSLNQRLLPVNDNINHEEQPGFLIYGYWEDPENSDGSGIAFDVANRQALESEGEYYIQDFRLQPDGTVSYSTIMNISPDSVKIPEHWYQ